MKKVGKNSSVDLLPRVLRQCEVQPSTSKGNRRKKERSGRSMIAQRQGGVTSTFTCVLKDILEKKWDKLCEMKEEIKRLLLEVTSSSKETAKVH